MTSGPHGPPWSSRPPPLPHSGTTSSGPDTVPGHCRRPVLLPFCRLVVTGDDDLLVDLALDSPPKLPPETSIAGPTFALEELACRKLLALVDRAEARDFADVYAIAQRYDIGLLLERAAQIDPGFDPTILAAMLGSLSRFDDSDIPVPTESVANLRRYFHK